MPPPPKQLPYVKFWPFVFKNLSLQKSPKIKVDWDKWQDEDAEKDALEDFDPDKLIDLMKKNGEWDEEDDEMYGPEALRKMTENPEVDDSDSDKEDENQQYKKEAKRKCHPPPDFDQEAMMRQMMGMPPEEQDESAGLKPPTEIGEDEDFLFENFLKKGDYKHMQTKKRQWRDQEDEDAELGLLDGIVFKGSDQAI